MSWSDFLFIPSGNQTSEEQAANYAALQSEYQRRLDEQAAQRSLPAYVEGFSPSPLENQDAAALAGFKEGLADGAANVRNTLGELLLAPFKLIPPIGWVLIAVGIFFWLGGPVWLRNKLK